MDIDPLAKYRRRQKPVEGQPVTESQQPPQPPTDSNVLPFETKDDELEPSRKFDGTGREVYQAFRVSPRREEHLEIRCASEAWHFPRFLDMVEIIPNQRQGTEIVLLFPHFAVFIGGRNLQQLVYALKAHRCAFVEEYHKDIFAPIEDEKAPFVSLIELKVRADGDG
jgi:hypothetical protein